MINPKPDTKRSFKNRSSLSGFTIVELLVVIIVIGILAVITVVSYAGITRKAAIESFRASTRIVLRAGEVYETENPGNHKFYFQDRKQVIADDHV